MTFIIFFLILSILVLIHEFGHFYAAKKNGVKVHEFGLGLPPKLLGKKFGETEYTFNLLPIGGFVKIEGEDPEEPVSDPERSFQTKSVSVRVLILLAGVLMNTVLAVFIFYFYFSFNGFLSNSLPKFTNFNFIGAEEVQLNTVIVGVINDDLENSLEPGDTIFNVSRGSDSINEYDTEEVSNLSRRERISTISSIKLEDFQQFIDSAEGEVTLYTYNLVSDEVEALTVTPEFNEELNRKLIGVQLGQIIYLDYGVTNLTKSLSGVSHSYNILGYSMSTLGSFISQSFATRDVSVVSQGVSGPVGIFSVVDTVLNSEGDAVFWQVMDLVGLLSLSLAFMNLLPIPALDGGRAVFALFEGVTGKRLSPEVEGQIHKYGMIFLLLLLALITIKDIRMFF